jgi:hypothetical protein
VSMLSFVLPWRYIIKEEEKKIPSVKFSPQFYLVISSKRELLIDFFFWNFVNAGDGGVVYKGNN